MNEAIFIPYEGGGGTPASERSYSKTARDSEKPVQQYAFNWSVGFFIVGNLLLELINFMYSNKVFINQDKYECRVEGGSMTPSFYGSGRQPAGGKPAALKRRSAETNVTSEYDSLFELNMYIFFVFDLFIAIGMVQRYFFKRV